LDSSFGGLKESLDSAYITKRIFGLKNAASNLKIELDVSQDKTKFKVGDEIGFTFKANSDCYVLLLHCSSDGKVSVLYPNRYNKDNFVKKGVVYSIPAYKDGKFQFHYRLGEPTGQEMVKIIATTDYLDPFGLDLSAMQDKVFATVGMDPVKLADKLLSTLSGKLSSQQNKGFGDATVPTGSTGGSKEWATDEATYIIVK
jgi:hypothetical protein